MHCPEAVQVLQLAVVDRLDAVLVTEVAARGLLDVVDHGRELVLRVLEPDGLDVGEAVGGVLRAGGLDKVQDHGRILAAVE